MNSVLVIGCLQKRSLTTTSSVKIINMFQKTYINILLNEIFFIFLHYFEKPIDNLIGEEYL